MFYIVVVTVFYIVVVMPLYHPFNLVAICDVPFSCYSKTPLFGRTDTTISYFTYEFLRDLSSLLLSPLSLGILN